MERNSFVHYAAYNLSAINPRMKNEIKIFLSYRFLLFLFSLISVFTSSALAQKRNIRFATSADAKVDSSRRRIPGKYCNQWSAYYPDTLHPEMNPVRYVRINVHVIQDGKGQNNFSEEEGRKFIKDMIATGNDCLEHNQKMNLPHGNSTPVLSAPWRWVLTGNPKIKNDDGIYFHRDDTLFCMNKKAQGGNSVYDARQYAKYGVQKDSVINIFLIEHCPDSIKSSTYKASNDGVGLGNWAKLAGCYHLWKVPIVYNSDTFRFNSWDAAGLLNHELGHCLGLQHTWNMDDGCDDTPKNPGCWNFGEPNGCTDVSNNVMDYNAYKNSFSPCQINKVLMNFYADRGGTRKYLIPQWCGFDSTKTIIIHSGESTEWNGSMDVYGNLIVENNATLTVHCMLSIPSGGKIILYPKSTLLLDGCVVTSRCNNPFDGIEIMTSKKSKPAIHLMNGAVVQNVIHAW